MPRAKKRRGKYDEIREKRRKEGDDAARDNSKRRKLNDGNGVAAHETANEEYFFEDTEPADDVNPYGSAMIDATVQNSETANDGMVYYGLLNEDEQAYYANVNTKIVANDFEDDDDKTSFIHAIYRESKGKEMMLASSQSCSRYLERVIKVSNAEQLREFFEAILEGLVQLMQHRFGSHVCETLFLECAEYVTANEEDGGSATITGLFLQAVQLVKQNIGFMATDRFASHTVRALLLVLSGQPLHGASTAAQLASKKKEKIIASKAVTAEPGSRKVPKSFTESLSSLTTAAVASLDTTYLRALATHSTGNPVLQLLLQLELINSDRGRNLNEQSLFNRLVEPESLKPDSEGAKFVSGLTYDATGSRLIEILVEYAPAKPFKSLYKAVWKEKLPSMAKNDIANYVAIKILERIGKDELKDACVAILADLPVLLERKRFMLLKTLVERSVARELGSKSIADAFKVVETETTVLDALLYPKGQSAGETLTEGPKADVHGSLLAQTMLEAEHVSVVIRESLSNYTAERLLSCGKDPAASRVLQLSLTSSVIPAEYRRKMVPKFYGHLATFATDSIASFVVDALWEATNGIHFMKERLARELAEHEAELRDSYPGRKVWKNWSMDLYARRRGEWQALAKGLPDGPDTAAEQTKTPIQLARERKAAEKMKREMYQAPAATAVSS